MRYVFTDEAGCLGFKRGPNISRYFIICTVQMDDCSIGTDLLSLRRKLAWDGVHLDADMFHATTDPEVVRDEVYELLSRQTFRVDATIFEKSKALPRLQDDLVGSTGQRNASLSLSAGVMKPNVFLGR